MGQWNHLAWAIAPFSVHANNLAYNTVKNCKQENKHYWKQTKITLKVGRRTMWCLKFLVNFCICPICDLSTPHISPLFGHVSIPYANRKGKKKMLFFTCYSVAGCLFKAIFVMSYLTRMMKCLHGPKLMFKSQSCHTLPTIVASA